MFNLMEFFNLARNNLLILILLALGINACSILPPFVDRRRNAGAPKNELYVGESTPEKPSICYNILTTDYKTVKTMADEECKKYKPGDYAVPVSQEAFSCRVLIPARINFKCVKN